MGEISDLFYHILVMMVNEGIPLTDVTAELDRRYQITDGIMRTLIVKRDPRHIVERKPKPAPQNRKRTGIDVEAIAVEAVEAAGE